MITKCRISMPTSVFVWKAKKESLTSAKHCSAVAYISSSNDMQQAACYAHTCFCELIQYDRERECVAFWGTIYDITVTICLTHTNWMMGMTHLYCTNMALFQQPLCVCPCIINTSFTLPFDDWQKWRAIKFSVHKGVLVDALTYQA